ncbi:GcrA family cell cycle regulator [Rhodoblastus acidophilus]|uniref:GcrA family cell cycle regulator n=1 Tax=Rhodoblastus acidophilus TaxID=1074 RepID=UPI000DAC61AF|nr:hypothetical protein CH337_22505 [Rhodoblastus acidophilus]
MRRRRALRRLRTRRLPARDQRSRRGPGSEQLTRPSSVSVIDPPEDGRFQLWHLTERMCHFPLGDPRNEDFRFCGAAKPVEGGPYCADHAQLAYTAARSDTREARRERGKMRFYEFTKVRAVV